MSAAARPAKRSDITDEQVVAACRAATDDPAGPSSLQRLVDATGAPVKVCEAAMLRAVSRGLIDYGVSLRLAWPVKVVR